MANKADKTASRGEIPMYRAQCIDWPEDEPREIGALDAPTAARIHAERMWKKGHWPNATGLRVLSAPAAAVRVQVHDPVAQKIETFTVRLKMEPTFEVVI
jgi:hypothetical protein